MTLKSYIHTLAKNCLEIIFLMGALIISLTSIILPLRIRNAFSSLLYRIRTLALQNDLILKLAIKRRWETRWTRTEEQKKK
jgi:hypothetical protein